MGRNLGKESKERNHRCGLQGLLSLKADRFLHRHKADAPLKQSLDDLHHLREAPPQACQFTHHQPIACLQGLNEREQLHPLRGAPSATHNRESLPYLRILRLRANVKNDREATAYLISKTFLCASGGWYILGLNRELDAVRRSGLCGMV